MAAPALYEEAIKQAILLLKFAEKERLAGPLAELMVEFAQEELPLSDYDLVTPVPLYPVRERERGYNQAALLAMAVAPACLQATYTPALRRMVPTQTQSLLTGQPRHRNVKGAFAGNGIPVKGKAVLLIDDVVTTGSTVNECAGTLLRAGAASVDVLAIALARLRSSPA
jgi:ComF family protein